MGDRGAVFVLPAGTSGQQGPVAAWVSTAGWAAAARRVLGASWIAAPGGLVDPEQALRRGSSQRLHSLPARSWRHYVPTLAKTAVKDLRARERSRQFSVEPDGPWRDHELAFVWQRHALFHTAGLDLARALDVPAVLFVPATIVWESERWGVRRPGWGRTLERVAEEPPLRGADLVACGSELVADQLRRLGVADERVVVTPSGVDVERFARPAGVDALRRDLGLEGRFVVGWSGSFRQFHALDQAIDAVTGLADTTLLLVGDGPERARVEERARAKGTHAVFTGTVPADALPAHLAVMDAALVQAPAEHAFHYSPLKLGEYLASGIPVVAPRVAELEGQLTDDVDAMLVAPADRGALAEALGQLRDDPERRKRLGAAARTAAFDRWSWDEQVRRVTRTLG